LPINHPVMYTHVCTCHFNQCHPLKSLLSTH
jgi:hypothetical protein